MLITLLLGFSSGLPLLLIGQTLNAWFTAAEVDRGQIGLFALAGLPYTLKFLWSPILDKVMPLPGFGRRRGWLLVFQVCVAIAIASLGALNPQTDLSMFAVLCVFVAFFSASQDIVIDAYRREALSDEELGLGSSLYTNGYRFAMFVANAGAVAIAAFVSWNTVYLLMATLMGIGVLTTLWSPEPKIVEGAPRTWKDSVVEPFKDYFGRRGAILILVFILLYKLGDQMASQMTTPFLLGKEEGLGFTNLEYVGIYKTFGLVGLLGGTFIGGMWMFKLGIGRALFVFGIFQAVSTAGFAVLWFAGHNLVALAAVITFENLASGMGTSAYAAYMASLTNRKFTATQYALLTSLMGVPRVIFTAPTGYLSQALGWPAFFLFCTLIAIPGLLLLRRLRFN